MPFGNTSTHRRSQQPSTVRFPQCLRALICSIQIDDLIAMAKIISLTMSNILCYKPSCREKYAEMNFATEKLALLASTIRNTKGINIKVNSTFFNLLFHPNNKAGPFSGCGAGLRFLALNAEGCYHPCSERAKKQPFGRGLESFTRPCHVSLDTGTNYGSVQNG